MHTPMGGFSLEFLDSDNHVGAMVVGGVSSGPSGLNYEDYRLGLGDRDSGDPVRMTAKYFSLSVQLRGPPPRPRPTFSVTGRADGRGSALAGIPRLAADELLVLRGFAIQTLRGNHHLRAVGVRHLRERNAISVTFADDSPEDDGFAFSVHYLVVLHASRTGRTRNPYFEGPFQQRFRFTESANVRKSEPGVAMLSGFTFRFADNDHHLRKIAIDPEPLDSFGVTFTDDERDHAVDGFLEYVLAIPYIW